MTTQTQRETYKRYYEKNKERIAARAKERRETDPDFHHQELERVTKSRKKLREQERDKRRAKMAAMSPEERVEYNKYFRDHYRKNLEVERPKRYAISKRWRENNVLAHLVIGARCRAKKLGLPFDMTADDLSIPDVCPILGIPIIINGGVESKMNAPSIDKVIPELGYVKGNVQIISLRANTLKSCHTLESLEQIRQYILKYSPD